MTMPLVCHRGHDCPSTEPVTWWRHQMETFSALLALCAGNSPVLVNSPHKGQWRGALMFSFIYAWINDWVNNREAGDLRRYCGHCDVNVMKWVKDMSNIIKPQRNTKSASCLQLLWFAVIDINFRYIGHAFLVKCWSYVEYCVQKKWVLYFKKSWKYVK